MAGTKAGGLSASETNKAKYGADYYSKIGKLGGQNGTTGGFGQGEKGRELARRAGALGGSKSKRKPAQEG